MKIAMARKLASEDVGAMTLKQLQKHKVKVLDAWRESRNDYGIAQAVRDGFYLEILNEYSTGYTPADPWLTQNLSKRLDEIERREIELLSQG